MRTLTAHEIQMALKREPKKTEGDKPDMTYADPEPRLEPSAMPTGQGDL